MSPSEPLLVTAFDRLRFLVIDDDRAILELVDAMLRMASVGSVVKAVSALAALNIMADQQKKYDCIVCDQGMSTMTGLELLKEIRTGRYTFIARDIPFIMLTAHGEEPVVRAAIELDVNSYIMKPVSKDSLIKAVHRAFNRTVDLKAPEDYSAVKLPAGDDGDGPGPEGSS
ncbi:MAG: response regulator [Rhodospirillaceae bacterium]